MLPPPLSTLSLQPLLSEEEEDEEAESEAVC
jgi:hypothetical protein